MIAKAVVLGFATLLVGCYTAPRQREGRQVDEEVVVRRIEEEVAAATERNDANTLAPYLAADFTFVNPAGLLLSKEQFLNNMRTGRLRNTSYKVDEMRVRIYGNAAVVTYRSTVAGTAGMQEEYPRRRRTTMLIKREGRWLIVAQQSTPMIV